MFDQRSIDLVFPEVLGGIQVQMTYVKLMLIVLLIMLSLKYNPKGLLPEVPYRPEGPAVSTSFSASQFESVADSNNLFRSFYQGTKLTRDNAPDNKEPVEVFVVAGTTVETTDTDLSKLKTS